MLYTKKEKVLKIFHEKHSVTTFEKRKIKKKSKALHQNYIIRRKISKNKGILSFDLCLVVSNHF